MSYHRFTTAQFTALYETAVAADGEIHGHARTQRILIDYNFVELDWAATLATGSKQYRLTSSAWSAMDTHIYWLKNRWGGGRSEFENSVAADPDAARRTLSKAQNDAYHASKESN